MEGKEERKSNGEKGIEGELGKEERKSETDKRGQKENWVTFHIAVEFFIALNKGLYGWGRGGRGSGTK